MQIKKGRKKHTGKSFFRQEEHTWGKNRKKRGEKHLRRVRKTREKEKRITLDRERKRLRESIRYIFLFTCFKFYCIK